MKRIDLSSGVETPEFSEASEPLDATLILIGTGCLVCLMPIGVYLLYMANLNSKPHAVMVPGAWDIAATLIGLSGCLIVLGPVFLTIIDSQWRSYSYGNWDKLKSIGPRESRAWTLMATGYFLILLGVIPAIIRARRYVTAIYHVDATMLEQMLDQMMNQFQFPVSKLGRRWTITPPNETPVTLILEAFPGMNHATLRWSSRETTIRPLIEKEIGQTLERTTTPRSSVAGWFFTAAISTILVVLFWMVVMVVVIMSPSTN